MSATILLVSVLVLGVEIESDDPQFGERVERVATRLADVRQLDFKGPVSVGTLDADEMVAKASEIIDEHLPLAKAVPQQLVLARLGLIPEDMDLREFYEAFYTDGVGGFYDSDKRELFVIAKQDDEMADVVIAHELTHALQDQHYDLSASDDRLEAEDDMMLAVQALVEGDATVAMMEYNFAQMKDAGAFQMLLMRATSNALMSNARALTSLLGGVGDDSLSKAPNAIQQEMIFPYADGLRFVRHGIGVDKWSVLADAHKQPPLSTEQILHPAKYFGEKDWPTRIVTPDVGVLLPGKWAPLSRRVAGEFGIRLILSEHPPERSEARPGPFDWKQAADGWDGDEVNLYRDRANPQDLAMVWYSTWDSEPDAAEFHQALADWVVARNPGAQPVEGAADRWTVDDNHIGIERRGADVVLLDTPHGAEHEAVVKALWEKTWKKEIRKVEDLDASILAAPVAAP